jgi:alkanesulfonate monooxygenase SsuD/methylene tetrahydromethanopterin reductase-like flavin-dependent oxidoreductase (luciferase family)
MPQAFPCRPAATETGCSKIGGCGDARTARRLAEENSRMRRISRSKCGSSSAISKARCPTTIHSSAFACSPEVETAAPTTTDEAAKRSYTAKERRYVMEQRQRAVIGGPEKCRRELEAMLERYAADELMILTITGDYGSRLRSYELLAGAF